MKWFDESQVVVQVVLCEFDITKFLYFVMN